MYLVVDDVEAVINDGVKVLRKGVVAHTGRPKGVAGHLHVQVVLGRHALQVVGRQRGQRASQGMPCTTQHCRSLRDVELS